VIVETAAADYGGDTDSKPDATVRPSKKGPLDNHSWLLASLLRMT
jgi:hypothetical protein